MKPVRELLTLRGRRRPPFVLPHARAHRRRCRGDVTGRGRGGRRQLRAEQRQARLGAVEAEDHRPARRGRREGADDVPDDPHRHESGPRRLGRGARRRERDLRARAQEPRCSARTPATSTGCSARSSSSAATRARPAACAASRWRCMDLAGKAWGVPAGRCSAAGSATRCGSTPTRPRPTTRGSRAGGSRRAWTGASRT